MDINRILTLQAYCHYKQDFLEGSSPFPPKKIRPSHPKEILPGVPLCADDSTPKHENVEFIRPLTKFISIVLNFQIHVSCELLPFVFIFVLDCSFQCCEIVSGFFLPSIHCKIVSLFHAFINFCLVRIQPLPVNCNRITNQIFILVIANIQENKFSLKVNTVNQTFSV